MKKENKPKRDKLCSVRVNEELLKSVLDDANGSGFHRYLLGYSKTHSVNASDLFELFLVLFQVHSDPYTLFSNIWEKYHDKINGIDKKMRKFLDGVKRDKGVAYYEANEKKIIEAYRQLHDYSKK